MKITAVPHGLLESVWPAAEPLITKAMAIHPHLKADGVRALLESGGAQLIVVLDDGKLRAAMVLERVTFHRLRAINIVALGAAKGFYGKYLNTTADWLENHARAEGASRLISFGRPGWARYFKRRGAVMQTVLMAWKDL